MFLRLKSPPEGGIWGGVRLVNDANGGDNTIGSKPTERKINKLHKRMNNKYSLPKDGGLISESAPRDIIHRYEKIHTKVYENEYEGVQYVADNIVKAIRMYNDYPIAPLSSAKASFAVRFLIHDKPGVLLQVAKEFADRGISINGVNQDLKPTATEPGYDGEIQQLRLVTHMTDETTLREAVDAVCQLDSVTGDPSIIRVLD